MPNTKKTVRALVSAFNVHNYARNIVKTNFTLQSRDKKDYIVVSFDKSMDTYQCRRYLDSIKGKIIREFYGIEESNHAEILNTAKLIFDVKSFPFNISEEGLLWDEQHGLKFVTPVDKGVIFNLKSHLASSLKKDVLEDMRVSSTTIASNKKKYLWHDEFDNEESRQQFKREFLSRMKARYENVPKNPLEVKGNSVYIKDVFNYARFIDSVTRYIAWLKGMGLQDDSKNYSKAKAFKNLIIEFINQSTGLTLAGFIRNFPLNKKTAKILVPVVLDNGEPRILAREEALELNYAFNYAVFNDLYGRIQGELSVNGSSEIYGIDFSNPEISHCVITKIMENSVINKDHELSIDPELHFQALSPAQSPFNSPTHAGSSEPRTPPNRRRSRDSGIGDSPPKPKDSGSSSGGPSSYFTESLSPTQEFPTQSQGEELKKSPRQGSEKKQELHNPVNLAGPSEEFPPSPQLSSSGPSSWKGANESGSASTSQPIGYWLSQSTSGNQWMQSQQLTEPGPSCSFWQKPSQVSSFMVNESSSSGCKISNELPPSNKLNNKEEVKIEKVDINIVKEAVKSKKHRLVEHKAKEGIERKAEYHSRIKPYEAATASRSSYSLLSR